jgi:hypothetical protein
MSIGATRIDRHRWPVLVSTILILASPGGLVAQERIDSLQVELTRLAALVDSLTQEVARLRTSGPEEEADDALARLRAAAQAAVALGENTGSVDQATEQEFVGRQRSLQALNPEISVNSDVFGHINKDDTSEDNFFAREFEISIVSNLDPFSRAKVFISHHNEGGELSPFEEGPHDHSEQKGGLGFGVEEGYVEWVGLPGGLGVKLGKFFQQFGQLNRWHSHALPFQTRSLPHVSFIGPESLAQTGASVHWLAPFGGVSGTYEATLEVTRSENEMLFGESSGLSVLGHINGFWNLSSSTDLDLGFSWINGTFTADERSLNRNLYGTEAAITWRPPGRSRYRGVSLRGGIMAVDRVGSGSGHEEEHEEEHELSDRAFGFWGMGEVRLTESWLVGARAGRSGSPEDLDETAWLFSPTLSWWQSEYVRLRLEYDLLGRSFMDGKEGRLLLQVTFAMGPHKHETY